MRRGRLRSTYETSGRGIRLGILVLFLLTAAVGAFADGTHSAPANPVHGAGINSFARSIPTPVSPTVRILHSGTRPAAGDSRPFLPANLIAPAANTSCPPPLTGVFIGTFPINFSVAVTPGGTSEPGPVNLTWNYTVYSGGLPPYHVVTMIDLVSWNFSALPSPADYYTSVGNATLSTPGVYAIELEVNDATCTQWGFAAYYFQVTGSLGAHPLVLTTTTSSPTVPARVNFSANVSAIPLGDQVLWGSYPFWGSGASYTAIFYLPGNYSFPVWLVDRNGTVLESATTPTLALAGPAPIVATYALSPGPVAGIENVTLWANLTNASAFPVNDSITLATVDAAANASYASRTTIDTSVNLSVEIECGLLYGAIAGYPSAAGTCEENATLQVTTYYGPNVTFETMLVPYFVPAAGNLSLWFDRASAAISLVNGTNVTQLHLNFSLAGGVTPDAYCVTVFGRTSPTWNGTFLTPIVNRSLNWTGAAVMLNLTLNLTGVYWGTLVVTDSSSRYQTFELPLIGVGVTLPTAYALRVNAGLVNETSAGTPAPGLSATFQVNVTGGAGAISVQWAFGDGAFAIGKPNAPITHTYASAGTYTPSVRVADASGDVASVVLPTITVTLSPVGPVGSTSGPGAVPPTLPGFAPPPQPPPVVSTPPTAGTPPSSRAGSAGISPPGGWAGAVLVVVACALLAFLAIGFELRWEGEALTREESPPDPPRPETGAR